MLPEVRTLRKRADFVHLKEAGKRVSTSTFVLQYIENKDETGVAVGYTASGKGVGNAVRRNRARRRLKACFDKIFRRNPAARGSGLWLVWVAKDSVLTIDFNSLEADMRRALAAAGVTW